MLTKQFGKSYVINIVEKLISDLQNKGIPFEYHIGEDETEGFSYRDEGSIGDGRKHKININIETNREQLTNEQKMRIFYGKDEIQFSEEQIMEIVATIFHEYRHLEQTENYKYNPDYSKLSSAIAKMNAIQQNGFASYYYSNYIDDPKEIDATKYGIEEAIKYIKSNFPEVNAENGMLKYIQSYIKHVQYDELYGYPMFDKDKSSTIEEILNQLQYRLENQKRVDLVNLNESDDEQLKKYFTEELKEQYNNCSDVEEKDSIILGLILKIHPEVLQEYPVLKEEIELSREDKKQQKKIEKNEHETETARESNSSASYYENRYNQNINVVHNDSVYVHTLEIRNKIDYDYSYAYQYNNTKTNYSTFVGEKLAEEYTRYEQEDKKDIIKHFAMLEAKGLLETDINPYDKYNEISYDNPKYLLNLEKSKGIVTTEYEHNYSEDLDLNAALDRELFIATYEVEQYDESTKSYVMKPIKEYYQENEKGELEKIGVGTEEKTIFNIEGYEFTVNNSDIFNRYGASTDIITQKNMADRLIKNCIEDSLNNGKISDVTQITDKTFLEDLRKQCGLPDDYPIDNVFIATIIKENGEKEFNLVTGVNGEYKDGHSTEYRLFEGIHVLDDKNSKILATSNNFIEGVGMLYEQVTTEKEFVTNDGHRYAITRNENGKLGFSEFPRENEKTSTARHVDTFALMKSYENLEINEQDLSNARKTLERTKEKREQTKDYSEQEK